MKEIKLSQGHVALVDDEDFEALNQFKWHANKGGNTFYAARNITVDGKRTKVKMHWDIMGGKGVDHRDGNGLNNQRSNLRLCSHQENLMNRRKHANASSNYKGVHWNKQSGKWTAQIKINGKRTHLGYFTDEVEAAKDYNLKAAELFGLYAHLNNLIK